MTVLNRLWILLPTLLLSACQTPPPKELPDIIIMPATQVRGETALERFESRQAILKRLDYWQLGGKLTVKGNERPTTAQLVWNQRGQTSALDLSGPVGIGSVTLEITPGASTLTRGNGKSVQARTPEELIERVIGWPMPASLLRWWVVGVADQGQLLSIDSDGRPEQFQYAEWTVSYSNYRELEGLPLPEKMLITDGHLELQLSRARWQLHPEPADARSRRLRIPGVDD
ncbi:MAG: lipoprotein insertase outer membrane protein LolB [Granulosicoccaceae bacterium]